MIKWSGERILHKRLHIVLLSRRLSFHILTYIKKRKHFGKLLLESHVELLIDIGQAPIDIGQVVRRADSA